MKQMLKKSLSLVLSLALLLTLMPVSYADDLGVQPENKIGGARIVLKKNKPKAKKQTVRVIKMSSRAKLRDLK